MAHRLWVLASLLISTDALRVDSTAASGAKKKEPLEKCPWRLQTKEDQCQWIRRDVLYTDWFANMRVPRVGIRNITAMGIAVWNRLAYDIVLRADFFEAWQVIQHWQACDVFAFKETWSYRDTDHLSYVVHNNSFLGMNATGKVTGEMVKSRLPKYRDFLHFLKIGDFAIVSDGHQIAKRKLGREIDDHLLVARFDRVNSKHVAEETGMKSNIHVVNGKMAGRQDAFMFDLDTNVFLRSWCQRLMEGGDYSQKKGTYLFMWTPTSLCRTNRWFSMFSREFLYYWFVGSLTNDVSLYGFLRNTTANHFNVARFVEAEQIVFEEIAKQWQEYTANASNPVSLNRRGKRVAGLEIRS